MSFVIPAMFAGGLCGEPAIFKWRQTDPELIFYAVRWYFRCSLSLRDVEELLSERGLEADHTTIWRWVQRYGLTISCVKPEFQLFAAPGDGEKY